MVFPSWLIFLREVLILLVSGRKSLLVERNEGKIQKIVSTERRDVSSIRNVVKTRRGCGNLTTVFLGFVVVVVDIDFYFPSKILCNCYTYLEHGIAFSDGGM